MKNHVKISRKRSRISFRLLISACIFILCMNAKSSVVYGQNMNRIVENSEHFDFAMEAKENTSMLKVQVRNYTNKCVRIQLRDIKNVLLADKIVDIYLITNNIHFDMKSIPDGKYVLEFWYK